MKRLWVQPASRGRMPADWAPHDSGYWHRPGSRGLLQAITHAGLPPSPSNASWAARRPARRCAWTLILRSPRPRRLGDQFEDGGPMGACATCSIRASSSPSFDSLLGGDPRFGVPPGGPWLAFHPPLSSGNETLAVATLKLDGTEIAYFCDQWSFWRPNFRVAHGCVDHRRAPHRVRNGRSARPLPARILSSGSDRRSRRSPRAGGPWASARRRPCINTRHVAELRLAALLQKVQARSGAFSGLDASLATSGGRPRAWSAK